MIELVLNKQNILLLTEKKNGQELFNFNFRILKVTKMTLIKLVTKMTGKKKKKVTKMKYNLS